MTRKIYSQELLQLKESLAEMGGLVETSLDKLLSAIENTDMALAEQIMHEDRSINDMERNIESQCLTLITKQQPIAGDLRLVSSVLKVVTDLERIGDHSSDIAELVLRLPGLRPDICSSHIQPMIAAAREMVHEALSAFILRDKERSSRVITADDLVDSLFNKVKDDITGLLRTEAAVPDHCIDVLMIAKYLERIGDHAVNISEWEIFRETGEIQDMKIL